jgi:hypothetical protein
LAIETVKIVSPLHNTNKMIYILFHAKKVQPFSPCIDGLFAAAIAYNRHPEAQLVPAMYGLDNVPKISPTDGDTVYLLDLTYPRHVIDSWQASGAKVIVLDHHKTAMQDLQGLADSVLSIFDMAKSGAMLAWDYFEDDKPPLVVQYVQDRDLWTKSLPGCDLVHLGLQDIFTPSPDRTEPKTLDELLWLAITMLDAPKAVERLKIAGEALQWERDIAIAKAVGRSTQRIIGGRLVPFVQTQGPAEKAAYSDIGNALLSHYPNAPFACVANGQGWALRSADDRLDVSEVAKSLGGGGHRNASGCRSGNPLAWCRD